MSTSFHLRGLALALVLAGATGCSSPKTAIYEHENFDDSGTFSRNYPVSDVAACEAARRALLSQGYIITSSDPKLVSGNKVSSRPVRPICRSVSTWYVPKTAAASIMRPCLPTPCRIAMR